MNNSNTVPVIKELVLVGGGHSHLSVLKYFAMNPVPGLRLTLITRDLHTPYSGMLPGYIAGHYDYDQAHIDLRPLAHFAKARIFHAEVKSIDLENKQIICPDRPPINYDLVSINIGSRPGTLHTPGADEFTIPVKPIDSFLSQWDCLIENILERTQQGDSFHLAVVGGGAGGVEMALATQYRLQYLLKLENIKPAKIEVALYSDDDNILKTHNSQVRRRFRRTLHQRDIKINTGHKIEKVEHNKLIDTNGNQHTADATLWVTNASAPAWLAESGLEVDKDGFIAVNDYLQSISHEDVFAAGDIAAVINHPRPKSGVFAVRQGMPLAKNLDRFIQNKKLKAFKPQKNFLGLISTGDKHAVASRSNWSLEGDWLWKIKDWIDRKFMDNFNELPEMKQDTAPEYNQDMADQKTIHEISAIAMRCGGCGAKVGSTVLSRVVNRLSPITRDDIIIGLADPDDAAVTEVPPGKLIVQSVDYFRSFIDDPYIFGQIAANHALSDIFAMGAESQSAMAIATIPYGIENQVEDQLFQTMSGALDVLNASNTALVGGHSSEGAELSFGLSVTGLADREQVMRKSGMQDGDVLILTKALGTGTLFAADMRLKAKGRWIDKALQSMLLSNQAAGFCMHRHGATACTDVTGFGLLGHLVEMTRSSGKSVEVNLDSLPVMDGALEMIATGIFSSLQEQNVRLRRAIKESENLRKHKHFPLLFDPQTSGGLLAAIPAANAGQCLVELQELGYPVSVIIGQVTKDSKSVESVTLLT
ncbi:MAG: selenide, water dikinase SelD [endosymbiont of Galathealinum brachiosum]|uniref:Selenide, water dikinase SelD n=1 Tax=endosymbiont of Galathealinum brachiosum TaxID=2200906 RepID=A0A370DF90_9GAMM|nr:MAG: selenide, water dikinase SelD [endosymbiont of Galathealinum brachiosum]